MDQQAVALKENIASTHTAQNNGKNARAHRRRRRRRNKKQQQDNSQQPDAFDAENASSEQLTPSTSKETSTIVKEETVETKKNKMPARFAEDVITAEPATTRTAPQLDLGGGHYVPRQQQLNDDVVISGFSGRLPESSNIEEFKQNLFNGVDMVNDDPRRWERGKSEDLSSQIEDFLILFSLYSRSLWLARQNGKDQAGGSGEL